MKIHKLKFYRTYPAMVLLVLLIGFAGCSSDDTVEPELHNITVGAILSLEGQWSTLGKNSVAALEIAEEEINAYFNAAGYHVRIDVKVWDSELDPEIALGHLEEAVSEGIEVIIGPQSSAELAALKPYADQNDVLVVSNGSTAGSLSLPGDHVFRFCPDGTLEGEALAAQIYDDGIRGLVTVCRDDVGNKGLEIDLIRAFEDLGGTVFSLDSYSVETEDFGDVISGLESELALAVGDFGEEQTGVYLAAFDEGVALLDQASGHPNLSAVRWYGGDGLVSSEALINNAAAAEFAIATNFIAPNFALPENAQSIWEPLSDEIESITGLSVSAFALAAYDALWVAALASESNYRAMGGFEDFIEFYVENAEIHSGATGPTELNQNGDRLVAAFGFWGIEKVNEGYQWILVGSSE